jgi:hypothetical protein
MKCQEIRLTRQQIRRLLSLPVDACEDAIRGFSSGFLTRIARGVLVRSRTAGAPLLTLFFYYPHSSLLQLEAPPGGVHIPFPQSLAGVSDC